jgi:hypothetical protein
MSTQPWAQALGTSASVVVRTAPAATHAGIILDMAGTVTELPENRQ